MKKNSWKPVAENRDWNKENITNIHILNLLENTITYADEMHKFYFNYVKKKRVISDIIRILVIICIALSFFLTLSLGFTPDNKESFILSLDFGAIALSSVLLISDKVFGLTEAWIRYTHSRFEIEKIVADYNAQFLKLTLNDSLELRNELLVDSVLNFDKSIRQLVIDETSTWSSNLRKQMENLSKRIDSELSDRKADIEKKIIDLKNKNENKQETGTLIVSISKEIKSSCKLVFDEQTYILESNQKSKVIKGIKQGIHIIQVQFQREKEKMFFENAIDIKKGINDIEIE